MPTLTSKIQYKTFETGEFIGVQQRTYEEVVELIETFPWEDQRDKIVIDLTNPSITIEGKNKDFLKFALFFNQKYVLHYFDENQVLFTKSFIKASEGYKYLKNYFDQPRFETSDFRKENTWLQRNLKHFVTQDFVYKVTPGSSRKFLFESSGMNFFPTVLFVILFISMGFKSINLIGVAAMILMVFIFGGGLHLVFFFNYYNYLKDKVLIMSKGQDRFYFGNINYPISYYKKDIIKYTTIRIHNSRNQLNGFAIVVIELNNGTLLKIPNLLIDYAELQFKLYEYPRVEKNKLPYLLS